MTKTILVKLLFAASLLAFTVAYAADPLVTVVNSTQCVCKPDAKKPWILVNCKIDPTKAFDVQPENDALHDYGTPIPINGRAQVPMYKAPNNLYNLVYLRGISPGFGEAECSTHEGGTYYVVTVDSPYTFLSPYVSEKQYC